MLLELLRSGRYDVVLPVHDQVFLLSRYRDELRRYAGFAVPEFAALERLQSKVRLVRVLDELKLWAQALRLYRSQNWDMAELQLLNLIREYPSRLLYRVFLDRIGVFRKNPPGEQWDGAYRFETK